VFISHLFLHILGVDIDLWVFSNEPFEKPSEQPSELLLGSYIWTSECFFFWVPSFFMVVLCAEHSDVLKHTNVLQHFEPYDGCLFISFKNYLKHINERSFVLTNKMILSLNLKSKRIFLYIWFIIACNWWVKPQVHGFTDVVKREYRSNRELFNLINF